MRNLMLAAALLLSALLTAQVKSPAQVIPGYGKQVSFYHDLEKYFEQLSQNSPNIVHQKYGQTYQGRSLNAYIISDPENIKNIENIRLGHLAKAGLQKGSSTGRDIAVVWLSFNVHGNEPGAAESAMTVAYELVRPDNPAAREWLKDVVVILDPCLNPDGYSRYGNWLRDISGRDIHPGTSDREHMEPWPGGRQNHYAYDLNRDWAWQTQAESRQRMDLYNQWMPMVHVDVHEMGYNEPYFFPPAAEPFHDFITKGQRDFHNAIGEATSKKFEAKGWSYYTRERFDLFYPSYGDTYPSFNGAVGMTYEQGGIGAGRAVTMKNGQLLTLQDRINHHAAAVLAAVETAAWQKDKLIGNFRQYFKDSRENPKGKYRTYIVKNGGKTKQLAELLTLNRIAFAYADESKKLRGYRYQTDKEADFTLEPNDIIVNAAQNKGVLAQILFEPAQRLTDSLSYDITAWALPHAYGIESYALKNAIAVKTKTEPSVKGSLEYENAYAYYVPWNGRESAKTLALLYRSNVKVRSARKASFFKGIRVAPGDLVIMRNDNTHLGPFKEIMDVLLDGSPGHEVIESGYALSGADLGGEYYALLKAPKVLILSGRGVSATDFGQAWFYMDQVIDFASSVVDVADLNRVKLSDYNTLILPDGWYELPEAIRKKIDDFADGGGKVIAIAGALNLFEDRAGYSLTKYATDESREQEKEQQEKQLLEARYYDYANSERRAMSGSVPGAIVENMLDQTHPLAYGLGDRYFSLKTNDMRFQLLKDAWNVAYVPANYKNFGFIGRDLKPKLQNTVTFAVQQKGEGKIIYMVDNPLFRGFWENGILLFSNALFQVD